MKSRAALGKFQPNLETVKCSQVSLTRTDKIDRQLMKLSDNSEASSHKPLYDLILKNYYHFCSI